MKYILKISFVLLSLVTLSCSVLNDFNEEEYVIIHVGFDTDKLSHTGTFVRNDAENQPTLMLPFYNGSGQEVTVGGYDGYIPEGLSLEGEYTVPTAEQGVLEIFVNGSTEEYGLDTLVFYVKTATRTWDITYPIEIESDEVNLGDLQLTTATLDAKVMRGVAMRVNDTTYNRLINIKYVNGYGRRVTVTVEDPSGTEQLSVEVDADDQFLASSEDENYLNIPISGKYTGSDEFIDMKVILTEHLTANDLIEDPERVAQVAELIIEDIPTVEPANLSFEASFVSPLEPDADSGQYLHYALEQLDGTSLSVSYFNGEYRDVTLTAKIVEKVDGVTGLYFSDPTTLTYESNYSLNADSGTITIPINGTPSEPGTVYVEVYMKGYGGDNAISDLSANTPESCTFTIFQYYNI